MSLTLQTERMQAHVDNGVGWMIFNNPERRNALSQEMVRAMPSVLDQFQARDDVRVVVMRGAGTRARWDRSACPSRRTAGGSRPS